MATRMYVCESAEHPSNLLMGLNEQRLQGQLCDITVRVQGHLFKAHTNVLASAMGYFRDLFLNPNKQVKKEIIEIPMIVNSVGFAKVLDFIYTSQLCLSQSSVMQVLCSACYLQIPYVVDKCQEFIVTHGHVSQQNAFPALTDHRYLTNKSSENQGCELINTPPSPGNQSGSNGNHAEEGASTGSPLGNDEPHDLSPAGSLGKSDNSLLIKQESGEGYGNGDQVTGGEQNPASRALIEFSNQSRLGGMLGSDINSPRNGALKILLQNGEGQGPTDPDVIDHNSLAEYFARNGTNAPSDAPYGLAQIGRSSPSTAIEQHLYSMTKSLSATSPNKDLASSPTSSVSQYLLSMKKEKPKKEYRCEYCDKLFGRQQHLKRHILTHTGERPYPCNLCEKRFRRSEHLKHHLVKHQQESGNVPTTSASTSPAFLDLNASRKRQRKPLPADAYSMSKMMLGSFSQPKPGEQNHNPESKAADLIGSNPILMTKLSGGSALDSISERLAFAAAQRGSDLDQDNTNETYATNADSPVALNLSSKGQSVTDVSNVEEPLARERGQRAENMEESSPNTSRTEENQEPGLDMSTNSTNLEENIGVNNSATEDMINSEDSKQSPTLNEQNSPNNMSIDSFAASEVVTPELKRLFAAMDG